MFIVVQTLTKIVVVVSLRYTYTTHLQGVRGLLQHAVLLLLVAAAAATTFKSSRRNSYYQDVPPVAR